MIRNQLIKGIFIPGPLFSKWIGVVQDLLDYMQLEDQHLFKMYTSLSSVVFLC